MKKKRKVGGNIQKASIAPRTNTIAESQKASLKDFKYKLQAELRQRTDSPKAKGIKTTGRASVFKRVPLNPPTKSASKKTVRRKSK